MSAANGATLIMTARNTRPENGLLKSALTKSHADAQQLDSAPQHCAQALPRAAHTSPQHEHTSPQPRVRPLHVAVQQRAVH